MIRTISILCVCLFSIVSIAKAQYGDECADAVTATLSGPNYFDTSSMNPSNEPDPDDSMCYGTYLNWNNSPDMWFVFTALADDTYNFSTCNLDGYDTSMVLYKGDCTGLIQIACNGDSPNSSNDCQPYYSEIEFGLIAETDYYVRIGGFGGGYGFGELTITSAGGSGGGEIWHVDTDILASGDGTSWGTAFETIEEALTVAVDDDEIWIAEGQYIPTEEQTSGDSRSVSFLIRQAISIYGGFDGTELTLEDRDVSSHHTILTGDIYGDDNSGDNISENAYHVISSMNVITGSIIIDGLWIYGGNANVAAEPLGGGIFIDDSTTVPINVSLCKIRDNNAINGGGIAVENTSLSLLKAKIKLNNASLYGGGLYINGDLEIDSCLITANKSTLGEGGGIITSGDLSILNTTISQNSSRTAGGISTYGPSVNVENSIIWGNNSTYGSSAQFHGSYATIGARYSCIEDLPDELSGNGNISLNPHFANPYGADGVAGSGDENYRLFQGSPCIDAGDNTVVTTSRDLDGVLRFIDDPYTVDTGNDLDGNAIADMGPFELVPADVAQDGVRIWSGLNSDQFQDPDNWLPIDVPGEFDIALFNLDTVYEIFAVEDFAIDKFDVSLGNIRIDLDGHSFQFRDTINPLQFSQSTRSSSLGFKNGFVYSQGDIKITGENNKLIINSDASMYAEKLIINDGAILDISGEVTANVINSGGIIDIGGAQITNAYLGGSLNETDQLEDPLLPSEIIFDIEGLVAGISHDFLSVSGSIDLTGMTINLRYSDTWTPTDGDVFNLADSGAGISGLPQILTYSGLPSEYVCHWENIPAARGGSGEATVTTTGPIIFGSANTTALNATPNDIVVADFDGVNGPDIAMSMPSFGSPATVDILLNNGTSGGVWLGFAAPISISTGTTAEDLEVGNLNDDNAPDLAVTNYDDDTVTILTNDGSASFSTTTLSVGTGNKPISLAIGDFNNDDGNLLSDLAVGCESSSPVGVQMYTNSLVVTADGRSVPSFTLASTWGSPIPTSIDPTDVSDNKDLDLIILSGPGNSVTVKRGDGSGNTIDFMAMPFGLPGGSNPVAASVALLNTDSYEDYITVNNGGSSLSILAGDGSTLSSPSSVTSIGDDPLSIDATDFDNDGDTDFVVSELDEFDVRQLAIVRNDSASSVVTLGIGDPIANGSEPSLVAIGDFDEDGLTDIISIIDLGPIVGPLPAAGVYLNETALACASDVNGTGVVDVDDLLALIAGWGGADPTLDIDGSGIVDVDDLLILIGAWGPC
jgi:hypothetical protein